MCFRRPLPSLRKAFYGRRLQTVCLASRLQPPAGGRPETRWAQEAELCHKLCIAVEESAQNFGKLIKLDGRRSVDRYLPSSE